MKTISDLLTFPADATITYGPSDLRLRSAWHKDRSANVKRSKRRIAIMSALATGWLPWGVEWHPSLTQVDREFILCCGHVLGVKEAQLFVSNGLLTIGPDQHGKDGLVITDAGRAWLQWNW